MKTINIVDNCMGKGKSTAAINYINKSEDCEKFLVITPYLDEVERFQNSCPNKNFKQPNDDTYGTKKKHMRKLLDNGENIVSTHALFSSFDLSFVELIANHNYTLILDETLNAVEQIKATKSDIKLMSEKYIRLDDNGFAYWLDEDYDGKLTEYKDLCDLGGVVSVDDRLFSLIPYQIFNAFRTSYVLTYMFEGQIFSGYLKMCGFRYDYYHVENMEFVEGYVRDTGIDFKNKVHILNDYKLNKIGRINITELSKNDKTLSKGWYERNCRTNNMRQLQNNCLNFFQNKCQCKSDELMWTTFKAFKTHLKGKGYTKGFLPMNIKATNEYRNRKYIAYLVNRFYNPSVKNMFDKINIKIDLEEFALSEMLQFIWRSGIRDNKEIWIYIPSVRMRVLLEEWLGFSPKEFF